MPNVEGFLPSRSAFHFSNSFPQIPLLHIDVGLAEDPDWQRRQRPVRGYGDARHATISKRASPHPR